MSIVPRLLACILDAAIVCMVARKTESGISVIFWDLEELSVSNGGLGFLGCLNAENHVGRH